LSTHVANPFRSPVSNARLTQSLFLEQSYTDRSSVLYTLKDHDHEGYKSLYRLYLACNDPTEISFANTYFDGWEHWTRICELDWFKPYVTRWRNELELQIRSKALANILYVAKDEKHKSSYEANKFLLSGGWKVKEEAKVGRPTKQKIREEAEAMFAQSQEAQDDFKRIQ
jgi:hypothetical protein